MHRMYEPRHTPPLPGYRFVWRVILHAVSSACLLAFSLLLGIIGYEYFEKLPWLDAFLNSAMLLGGMGPVNAPQTHDGKVFAGLYALYAGLVFLIVVAILLTPVVHRILHKFHWDNGK